MKYYGCRYCLWTGYFNGAQLFRRTETECGSLNSYQTIEQITVELKIRCGAFRLF